ncbi:MAG TPA: ATP-binding cassette domain-containing protein, partial [Bacteroidales bacterium]|nr:ATP-binding cassette domain-containing protein [Bacteroidales bacterium]
MNDKVLRIENLSVANVSGDRPILQNISFDITRGKITGIVGESGSGKSVTALTLMRLLPPGL